jgi:hypothetical protein
LISTVDNKVQWNTNLVGLSLSPAIDFNQIRTNLRTGQAACWRCSVSSRHRNTELISDNRSGTVGLDQLCTHLLAGGAIGRGLVGRQFNAERVGSSHGLTTGQGSKSKNDGCCKNVFHDINPLRFKDSAGAAECRLVNIEGAFTNSSRRWGQL